MTVGTLQTYWIAASTSYSPAVRLIDVKLLFDPLVWETEMLPLVTNSPTKPVAASLFLGQRLRRASGRLIGVLLTRRAILTSPLDANPSLLKIPC